jgi:hypothetical protein
VSRFEQATGVDRNGNRVTINKNDVKHRVLDITTPKLNSAQQSVIDKLKYYAKDRNVDVHARVMDQ